MKIVAFVPDLMDKSRFASVDPKPVFVRSVADLKTAEADIFVADLSRPGAVEALMVLENVRKVGFISHESTEEMAAAKAAGIETYPRSRFFSRIVDILAQEAS